MPDFVLALHAALNVLLVPGIPVMATLQVGLAQHNVGLQKQAEDQSKGYIVKHPCHLTALQVGLVQHDIGLQRQVGG